MLSLSLPKNKALTFGDETMAVFSIIKLSELEGAKRIDAEYYKPEYLIVEKKIKRCTHDKLNNLISILTDYHANGSYETLRNNVELLDKPDYALMLRTLNFVRDDFKCDVKYISKHAYNFLVKTQLFGYEVVINKIGEPGEVYMVPPLPNKMSLGMNLFMIKPKEEINGKYLYVYLISSFGKIALKRRVTGAVPLSIDKDSVRDVLVPVLNKELQLQINNLIENHFKFRFKSHDFYSQAETLLLEELGLKDFKPKYEKTYTAKLSDAFSAHRIDAEYFQPAYEEVVEKLREKNIELKPLRKFILSIQKGIEPGSENYQDEGKPFIRVSNLSINGLINRDQKYLSKELYRQLRETYEPKQGDFLLTKDATPGIAYVVKEQIEGIISSGILKLQINESEINKEYLALCINSLIGRMQIERDGGGSVIVHWKPEQVKTLKIPLLPLSTQQKIASLVQQSHNARRKAKELLEVAKRAVELAIEKNEKEALDYITQSEKK